MSDTAQSPLTVADLHTLLGELLRTGEVTPGTPVAASSDPEGNAVRHVSGYSLDQVAASRDGRIGWNWENPGAPTTGAFILWPM